MQTFSPKIAQQSILSFQLSPDLKNSSQKNSSLSTSSNNKLENKKVIVVRKKQNTPNSFNPLSIPKPLSIHKISNNTHPFNTTPRSPYPQLPISSKSQSLSTTLASKFEKSNSKIQKTKSGLFSISPSKTTPTQKKYHRSKRKDLNPNPNPNPNPIPNQKSYSNSKKHKTTNYDLRKMQTAYKKPPVFQPLTTQTIGTKTTVSNRKLNFEDSQKSNKNNKNNNKNKNKKNNKNKNNEKNNEKNLIEEDSNLTDSTNSQNQDDSQPFFALQESQEKPDFPTGIKALFEAIEKKYPVKKDYPEEKKETISVEMKTMQNVENQQKIIDNFVQNLVDLRKNTSNEKDNQKTIQKNCISNQGNGGDSTESYGDSFYSKNQGGSWSKLITKQELRKLARNPTENLVSIYLKGLILENKVSRLMIYEKEGAIPTKKPREELRNDQKNISII